MGGNLRFGRVVETHPESNSVTLIMTDDATRYSGVPVMTFSAGSNFGFADLPEISNLPVDQVGKPCVNEGRSDEEIERRKWSLTPDPEEFRMVIAVVGEIQGYPVVLGFIHPEVAETMFDRKGWRIDRHSSDFVTTIDREGNCQMSHPTGTVVRIGEGDPEDLTAEDYDQRYQSKKNKVRFPKIRIEVKNPYEIVDGEIVNEEAIADYQEAVANCEEVEELPANTHCTIEIDEKGNVSVSSAGNVEISGGLAVRLSAPEGISFSTPEVVIHGNLIVDDKIYGTHA